MKPKPSLVPAVLTLLALACTEPQTPVMGEWIEVRESSSYPARQLELKGSGTFVFKAGASTDGTRTEGTYEVRGASLTFSPQWLVTQAGTEPYPWGRLFNNATFAFEGDVLVLSYTSYPFDGPVATTMRWTRLH